MTDRADVDVETLLKVVLVLVVVWIALEIVGEFLDILSGLFGSVLGIVILVLIVLWLTDRL